jgi:hypothetical protein
MKPVPPTATSVGTFISVRVFRLDCNCTYAVSWGTDAVQEEEEENTNSLSRISSAYVHTD